MFERELRLNGLMNGYLSRLLADFDDGQLNIPIADGGNSPAWILAHLAVANDYALRMLGEPRLAPAEWHKRFGPGRSPKDDPNPLPSKLELAENLKTGQQVVPRRSSQSRSGADERAANGRVLQRHAGRDDR